MNANSSSSVIPGSLSPTCVHSGTCTGMRAFASARIDSKSPFSIGLSSSGTSGLRFEVEGDAFAKPRGNELIANRRAHTARIFTADRRVSAVHGSGRGDDVHAFQAH